MKGERRKSSLLELFAEPYPLFYKGSYFILKSKTPEVYFVPR